MKRLVEGLFAFTFGHRTSGTVSPLRTIIGGGVPGDVGRNSVASRCRLSILTLLALALAALTLASAADATTKGVTGEFATEAGQGGGQVDGGRGVAVNVDGAGGVEPGSFYVPSFWNRRVDQFTADGAWVRSFGWDVVASGEHDVGVGFEICEADSDPVDVCKAGLQAGAAGAISNPEAIALDPSTGNVFVADNGGTGNSGKRIDVFSAKGAFEGAFGWGVDTGAATLEFCTIASTCQAGTASAEAGAFSNLLEAALAVDPTTGNLYVGERGTRRINEFSFTLNGSDEVTDVTFVRAFGWDVVPGGTPELETCTTVTGCQAAPPGGAPGQFPNGTPTSLAVDSEGHVYAAAADGNCNATTNPCRVQKFNPDGTIDVSNATWGPDSGGAESCQLNWTADNSRGQGPVGITVDQLTGSVYVTRKASTAGSSASEPATFELCEFDSNGTLEGRSPLSPLFTNNQGYLQPSAGADGSVYINAPIDANHAGAIYRLGPVPPPGVQCLEPSDVEATAARLNGRVIVPAPGGAGHEPRYRFEYSADNGLTWKRAPNPEAPVGTDVAGPVAVDQEIGELQPNLIYRWRLAAATTSEVVCEGAPFKTSSTTPGVARVRALPITDTTATLRAQVTPHSSPTTYRFQWGTTTAYGNKAPAFGAFAGEGASPVAVATDLAGLQPGTEYHFRLVATNEFGTAFGPDAVFVTNQCPSGTATLLPDCRKLELVSPADQGPVAEGNGIVATSQNFQTYIPPAGNRIAFVEAYGLSGATTGAEVLYDARRRSDGWESTQLSAPLTGPSLDPGVSGESGWWQYLSEDGGCGALVSSSHLDPSAPTQVVEEGGVNLYRWDEENGFAIVTALNPLNPSAAAAQSTQAMDVIGADPDCDRIVFQTDYQYPGIPYNGGLYEWRSGVLDNPTSIPGPSGPEIPVDAGPGDGNGNYINAARDDYLVFSAARLYSPIAAEVGQKAIFMRKGGGEAVDVSRSETAVPSRGAQYEITSKDGERVFFLGNYGLTAAPSNGDTDGRPAGGSGGGDCSDNGARMCDLYEYDFGRPEGERLVSLTATTAPSNPVGAVAEGILDVSDDGADVYFIAKGQLVPGRGNSFAENISGEGAFNLYVSKLAEGGSRILSYIATLPAPEMLKKQFGSGALVSLKGGPAQDWSSRATPDGEHLLFQTAADIQNYDSGGALEAYLYDAGSDSLACLSCRTDGEPSVGFSSVNPRLAQPLPGRYGGAANYQFRARLMSDDGDRVFFDMPDALAPGAVDGHVNIYEWEKGVVSLIAGYEVGTAVQSANLMGTTASGDQVFFSTPERLLQSDLDDRRSVYVANVRGGFEPPTPPSVPCDPLNESSCQGPASPGVRPPDQIPSLTFAGSGNVNSGHRGCRKGKLRRGGRCLTKRQVARRACRKVDGKPAKRRCIRKRLRHLSQDPNQDHARRHQRRADHHRRRATK